MPVEQTEATTKKTAVFDEHGQTVEEIETAPAEEITDQAEAVSQDNAPQAPGKYRIGDRLFATQEEALEYAQSQVSALETEQQIADAYRQGMREALSTGTQPAESVTPKAPAANELDTEELYTNPQAFLNKFATKIKTETRSEIDQVTSLKQQSDQIWREFTERHPALADFRSEVEGFVGEHTLDVRGIISTKGRPASYDWIATKLKSRFEAYANAVKPKRELPNGSAGASPSTRAGGVPPKEAGKKPSTFSEQIRNIRKKQR